MASDLRSFILPALIVGVLLFAYYLLVDPTLFGLFRYEGFADAPVLQTDSNESQSAGMNETPGDKQKKAVMAAVNAVATPSMGNTDISENFANMDDITGPAAFDDAHGPAGCYPRDQLTPGELLPKDGNSTWAQQNPMGTGSLKGKNFLSAGALIGVNTVSSSLRNANLQLRSEPANPQVPVSVFNNTTIEPDTNRRDLEIH